jgi:hypothetical protein
VTVREMFGEGLARSLGSLAPLVEGLFIVVPFRWTVPRTLLSTTGWPN